MKNEDYKRFIEELNVLFNEGVSEEDNVLIKLNEERELEKMIQTVEEKLDLILLKMEATEAKKKIY